MYLAALTLASSLSMPQQPEFPPISEERLAAAYADARAACKEVLGVDVDSLPPLKVADAAEVARVVAEENLPLVRLREPNEDKAGREATALGKGLAEGLFAKYAWSSRSLFVVPKTWEKNATVLKRPQLTADNTLRAVLVHELCHAIDDGKFEFGKRMLEASTTEAATALNAVIEGHAQLATRRICKVRGWSDGFDAMTGAIGAIPDDDAGEAVNLLRRGVAAALTTAYVDGEKFAAAVIEARPETGARDIFLSPPKDPELILQPLWYLDPSKRPATLFDPEPAIDAFVAKFDKDVWTSVRNSPTAKQLASGMTMVPKDEVDAVIGALRNVRFVQCVPTASPQSKVRILIVMEFADEAAARRWVALSGVISDKKDESMREGQVRITGSKTTKLESEAVQGLLQEKTMKAGGPEFEVTTIDASRGRMVVETIFSGEPPPTDEHVKIVDEVLTAIVRKK